MSVNHGWKRSFSVIAVFVAVWLGLRYLFPLFLPFLLGLALALFSEPMANIFRKKLRWRTQAASFVSVTLTLAVLGALVWALGAIAVDRAAALARSLGDTAEQIDHQLQLLRREAALLASKAPGGLAGPLRHSVEELFTDGGALLDRGTDTVLGLAGQAATRLPGSLVTFGTAVLAGYMLCPRLPQLRRRAAAAPLWHDRLSPALSRLGKTAGQWFRAQLRLSGVTFCIVLAGFFLLGVKSKLPMALLTAAVDAVPLLGTGTVLLPWSLVCLLQGEAVRAVGLLSVYVTALLVRSSLEPKLVGRQLGLDPLVSLMALYTGYRIWGFGGMILAPILTVTARELCRGD